MLFGYKKPNSASRRRISHLSHLFLRVSDYLHFGTAAALFLSAFIQVLTFVILARGLGADTFGLFMAIQAIGQLTFPAVSVGSGEAFIRRVSRDHSEHARALGHALLMTATTGVFFAVSLAWLVGLQIDLGDISFRGAFIFFIGELLGIRFGCLAEHCFIGHSAVYLANGCRVALAASRLGVVAAAIYLFGVTSLEAWIVVQGGTSFLFGAASILAVTMRYGGPAQAFHSDDLRFGALITLTQFSQAIQTTVDRIALSATAAPSIVAAYSAAIKSVQFAIIPTSAVLRNTFSHFFVVGATGIGPTIRFAFRNIPRVLITGFLATLGLLAGADLVVAVLGPGFYGTSTIIRWLSGVVALQGVQLLLADSLTGTDRQVWRTAVGLVSAVIYISAIVVLGSLYGVKGLVIGIYLSQGTSIILHIIILLVLAKREEPLR